ncbi:unnamed protein product [Rotaria sordida]|uniref:Microbial-type PARG catalytic domain-containing protein n=1 Tax=Rotaria sordida TaxID=392033 RepID=A0A814C6D3_9BILA|nr:unnamed protein product [Rotaria sordida]
MASHNVNSSTTVADDVNSSTTAVGDVNSVIKISDNSNSLITTNDDDNLWYDVIVMYESDYVPMTYERMTYDPTTSEQTSDETSATHKRSIVRREDSSSDFQTNTTPVNMLNRSSLTGSTLNRRSSLPQQPQSKTDKQSDESRVGRSPILSSKHDQQSLHSCSSNDNNYTLYNSDHLSQSPTTLRHSIEKSNTNVLIHTSPISDAGDQKYQGGDEIIESKTITGETNQNHKCRTLSRTNDLINQSLQSTSKPTLRTSKSFDASVRHRLTPPHTPPSTPEMLPKGKRRLHVVSLNLSTSEESNDSSRPSIFSGSSHMKQQKQNKKETLIVPSHTPQRSPYDQNSSPIDDQQRLESPAYDQAYYQSREIVRRPKQSINIAYVPSLPSNDFSSKELESTIHNCLYRDYQLQVSDIKCSSQLDVGIVYLRNEKDKSHLVNTIKSININSKSNETVSFVAEFELVSYVVIEPKNTKDLPLADDICQQWIKVYNGNRPLKCENLCDEFRNIFRVVTNIFDELTNTIPITEFLVGKQKATVYFRADCCFFENLPRTFNEDNLKYAIGKQISEKNISNESIYIRYNKTEANAVVLTCNKARKWALFRSINLDGQFIMKKDKIIYRFIMRSVPKNISVSYIKNSEIFAGTVIKAISCDNDIILELLSKNVYEKCLKQGVLRINGHTINIETYSLPNNYEDLEIDADNWYETEMCAYKSDIMQFIIQPEHPIFQFKWNSKAFLEQFHRWTLKDTNERDHHETISNQQRHLLRMTVMLNTIGILKKGSYYIADKEIKLKSDQLETIVYNHQSKLQPGKTIKLSAAINYPHKTTLVNVINEDCLIVYDYLVSQGYRPLLLNMANAYSPGGGYRKGDGAQEENLFRRSDYFRSLDMDLDDRKPTDRFYCTSNGELKSLTERNRMYPMDEFGAIYTSGLTFFRHSENVGYDFMDKPMFNVCAIAIAAYRNPKLDDNNKNLLSSKYSIRMRKKIENIFAIAHHHKHDCLVLSAFGCGAFRNPPEHVAIIFKSVIEQYAGFFKRICFAIIDDHNTGHEFNPHGNYQPFREVLDNLEIKPTRQKMIDMMIGPWRILNETNNDEITLSSVRIHDLPLCRYGGRCRDLENKQHCREYLHPPLCPYANSSKYCELKDNNDHMLWFKHQRKSSHDAKRELIDTPMNNMDIEYDVNNKKRITEENRSFLQTCPFTPYHCRYHTLLSESTNIQTLALDVRNHCREFLHVCRFGRQCRETSSLHLEKTIHIARNMCPYGDKCFKLCQEDHLNSFSHLGIPDIRHLCMSPAYECRDLQKREHIIRYRHNGNYDRSGVIQYCRLNKHIDFLRNQQIMIEIITEYTKNLQSKVSLSISNSIQRYIKGLLPVYQCSKVIFELILVHGHVMSHKRIDELKIPKYLIQSIQRNKKIESIITQYNNPTLKDRIKDYINAIVSNEYSKRDHQTKSRMTNTRTTSSHLSTVERPDDDFNNTIRNEENFLKGILSLTDIDIIRRCVMEIIEASSNLEINSTSSRKTSEELSDVDEHIDTILGPRLHPDGGNIVLIFKRQVMLHPDANFSIQSKASFLNGTTFIHRPWIKDSSTREERFKQFQKSKLHCSILGYEHSAAAELIAATGLNKKTMDVDLKAIIKHLTSIDSDQLFEGHLPDFIPLNYIAEVYIPKNLFASLTPTAQTAARSIFRDSLRITNHEINLNPTASRESRVLQKNRTEYQQHVIDKLVEKFDQNINCVQQLRGIAITLPSSRFVEHVALPFTIAQIYDQYRRNRKQDSISDEIYVYFQAMYGDVMITLSKERIDGVENRRAVQCLVCYIAETPSTTPSDYKESYSYLNYGDPFQHASIMDSHAFLAHSNIFHRGCNVDDFLNYCLKLEKNTGQVTLSHVGPNSIYNYDTISYRFKKSNLDLNDLNYIHISAGLRQVPIRNMMVCFHQVPELHPTFKKNFKRNSTSLSQQNPHSSDRCQSAAAAKSTDDKSQSTFSKSNKLIRSPSSFDIDKEKLRPCRDSINCLQQTLDDHCKRYSHPCRFSELCRNQDKEPYLTHEPHPVEKCLHDTFCKRLDDPFHRATYRHTNLPDFLIPCRDQRTCQIRSTEHRIKYSHGENVERISTVATIDKPRMLSQASSVSSESYAEKQHNRHENRDEQIPCRYGSKCRDQNNSGHCSRYSHPSELGLKSSFNQDRSRIPCSFGSACYNTSDADHCSKYSHSSVQGYQPEAIGNHQRIQCPSGIKCRNNDALHLSKYSHSFK